MYLWLDSVATLYPNLCNSRQDATTVGGIYEEMTTWHMRCFEKSSVGGLVCR